MKKPGNVRSAGGEDIEYLAARIRDEHAREIAEGGLMPPEALRKSYRHSVEAWVATAAGRPFFVMGAEASGMITASAVVWMLGTDGIDRRPAATLRAARWGIRRAYEATGAAALEQWIPSWYRKGIDFVVRGLGFEAREQGSLVHVIHRKGWLQWAH